jgi:hypothetical protein
MSDDSSALRIQLLIGFMCAALVGYFVLLGRQGVLLVASGKPVAAGLGIAVLLLPIVGLWAMIATLRAGFTHQRLAAWNSTLAHSHAGRRVASNAPRPTPSSNR